MGGYRTRQGRQIRKVSGKFRVYGGLFIGEKTP
jgi:hypothetical protein